MPSPLTMPSSANLTSYRENHTLHSVELTLKLAYGLVPIIAGADKFMNFLTNWEAYLNPALLRIIPLSGQSFMHIVGVIEIIAGILVLIKPRYGGFLVMAWLFGIALTLVGWGRFLDVAVRDIMMGLGALTLARLAPLTEPERIS